jgi:hypothetical protein
MGSYTDGLFKRKRMKPSPSTNEYTQPNASGSVSVPERLVSCGIIRNNVMHSYGLKSHGEIRQRLGDKEWSKSSSGDDEGFVTSKGRFVSRDEANRIGAVAGQCARLERKFLSSDVYKW